MTINKHLPSDIDSLTKKELVEIYHMQVEEYQLLVRKFDYIVDLYEWRIERMEKRIGDL
jgi:hypothetical protein